MPNFTYFTLLMINVVTNTDRCPSGVEVGQRVRRRSEFGTDPGDHLLRHRLQTG